jgi:hypothetical protein
VMATRAARKQKAMPRPARPRPATTVRPPAPNSVAPGPPASRGMPLPTGLAPRGLTVAPVPASTPSPPAGARGAAGRAEHAVLQPAVTATCWVDPGERGTPYESVIRFTGRRAGITGKPSPADRFEREKTVRLIPGSGPVAVTTRVENVNAGEWVVSAHLADRHSRGRGLNLGCLRDGGRFQRLGKTLWTKGNPVTPEGPGTRVRTRVAALATAPGIITGSWAAFVAAGLGLALAVLVVLLARVGVSASGALAVALVASLAGAAGCPRLVRDAAPRPRQRAGDPGPVHPGIHRGRGGGRNPRCAVVPCRGLPVCNKLVVLAVGASGALSYWAPVQSFLALASGGLLVFAVRQRLRGMKRCPVR